MRHFRLTSNQDWYFLVASVVLVTACPLLFAAETQLPDCVHWRQAFVFTEFMPRGEVVGTPSQKLPMFRQNPQVCAYEKLMPCETKRFIITGDRVTIGHECGQWAHVQFQSRRTRSEGWVDLTRLKVVPPDKRNLKARSKWKPHEAGDPLEMAVDTGDFNKVKILLKSKADVNRALELSVAHRKSQLVAELIALGARPNETAAPCKLMTDAIQGNQNILAELLNAGGQLNCNFHVQGISPLKVFAMNSRAARPSWAAIGNSRDPGVDDPASMFTLFLLHRADLNIKDVWNGTPLRATLEGNNVDIATLLLESGADVNNYIDDTTSIGEQHGNTILMEAIFWYPLTWDASLIRVLLSHGADVNYRNELPYDRDCDKTTQGKCTFRGQTALTRAASDGLYAVVKVLLEHGANPTLPRTDGASPAEIARENGHARIASLIQQHATN